MSDYANRDVLVSTDWVAEHLDDPQVRLVEVDVDTSAYESGHIPGAVGWNWKTQLQEPLRRDVAGRESFQGLLEESGIAPETLVVLYGDNSNWFATWAFWQLAYYGHRDARIVNGGRKKWLDEGREVTGDVPSYARISHPLSAEPRLELRALREWVLQAVEGGDHVRFVDVRSPAEFAGELLAPEGLPQEGAQRGGHIPGARNVTWSQAVREDGTFKSADELRALYEGAGLTPDSEVVAYCRIGERSSHTWFVLSQLLGYPRVRNYDGSWTEYGSLVGAPIER